MADDDELDPSDWLASQFETKANPVVPPAAEPAPPAAPTAAPIADAPAAAPASPLFPIQPPPAAAPPPFTPPPLQQEPQPPYTPPPSPQLPPVTAAPLPAPSAEPAAPVSSGGGSSGGGFQWGLTPGGEVPAEPAPVPAPEPTPEPAPYVPPTPYVPPVPEPAPYIPEPASYIPPAPEPAPYIPAPDPAPYVPPAIVPEQPFYIPPAIVPEQPAYVVPPVVPEQPFEPPTTQYTTPVEPPTTAYPQQEIEPVAFDATQWLAAPVDSSLEGVTEVLEAEIVGNPVPEGEGLEPSALDSLFGEQQFTDYAGQSMIQVPPPRLPGGDKKKVREPGGPIPRNQKILMWVAGGLVAVLALVALFLVGTRLAGALGPSPALAPSPSPSPSATGLPLGPVEPGEYQWDALLGGECIQPFENAWQDRYVVVDCTKPHAAQMVHRGEFPEDPLAPAYPGLEELQKRINLLCTAPTIIDYAAAGAAKDIEISASFAVDADEWDEGNREYFCFVSRTGGAELTTSVAMPQVAPTPTPLPTP